MYKINKMIFQNILFPIVLSFFFLTHLQTNSVLALNPYTDDELEIPKEVTKSKNKKTEFKTILDQCPSFNMTASDLDYFYSKVLVSTDNRESKGINDLIEESFRNFPSSEATIDWDSVKNDLLKKISSFFDEMKMSRNLLMQKFFEFLIFSSL
ncbi:hypothetical protein [Candidatus Phytoplasma oryzae]|nr:hypothetical protein PIE28_01095 [Candidatus Phytoplasma oryzae]